MWNNPYNSMQSDASGTHEDVCKIWNDSINYQKNYSQNTIISPSHRSMQCNVVLRVALFYVDKVQYTHKITHDNITPQRRRQKLKIIYTNLWWPKQ